LLDVARTLKEHYGTLTELVRQSQTAEEVSARLQAFKSIGPKTVEIFLRDIAPLLYKNGHKKHDLQGKEAPGIT